MQPNFKKYEKYSYLFLSLSVLFLIILSIYSWLVQKYLNYQYELWFQISFIVFNIYCGLSFVIFFLRCIFWFRKGYKMKMALILNERINNELYEHICLLSYKMFSTPKKFKNYRKENSLSLLGLLCFAYKSKNQHDSSLAFVPIMEFLSYIIVPIFLIYYIFFYAIPILFFSSIGIFRYIF